LDESISVALGQRRRRAWVVKRHAEMRGSLSKCLFGGGYFEDFGQFFTHFVDF
jgi:hypothetical protein